MDSGYLCESERTNLSPTLTQQQSVRELHWFINGVNNLFLLLAVCNSIKNPVTKDNLLEFIDLHRFKDENDRMPPPQRPVQR